MNGTRPYKGVTVDPHMSALLQAIKARTGLSEAEQIRRGIQMWLQAFEWTVTPDHAPTDSHTQDR
jgi:hypothetical protein